MDLEEYEVKKKAQELVRKFLHTNLLSMSQTDYLYVKFPSDKEAKACAVECAQICVKEFISDSSYDGRLESAQYWVSVHNELEKMK